MSVSHTEPFDYETGAERVIEPARIRSLMRSLGQADAELTLTVPEVQLHFNALIRRVDMDGLRLELRMEVSEDQREAMMEVGMAHAFCEMEGVKLHFRTVLDVDDEPDIYHLAFPVRVDAHQRREHMRLPLGQEENVAIRMEIPQPDGNARFVQGWLSDISMGGMSLTLPSGTPIDKGLRVEECAVALPDGDCLQCGVCVRHAREDETRGMMQVGVEFDGLDVRQERVLHRFVLQLQRAAGLHADEAPS
ncbi:MAG: flagellar brake protein [Ectothiorhodospiraceae bacterium]|jgi:c-di-GMP-binding flagellar brake protein YcgR|nr:flagellar brake protein [Ectothiorhodospiraceae bacterium]